MAQHRRRASRPATSAAVVAGAVVRPDRGLPTGRRRHLAATSRSVARSAHLRLGGSLAWHRAAAPDRSAHVAVPRDAGRRHDRGVGPPGGLARPYADGAQPSRGPAGLDCLRGCPCATPWRSDSALREGTVGSTPLHRGGTRWAGFGRGAPRGCRARRRQLRFGDRDGARAALQRRAAGPESPGPRPTPESVGSTWSSGLARSSRSTGSSSTRTRTDYRNDRDRANRSSLSGLRVLRFSYEDVMFCLPESSSNGPGRPCPGRPCRDATGAARAGEAARPHLGQRRATGGQEVTAAVEAERSHGQHVGPGTGPGRAGHVRPRRASGRTGPGRGRARRPAGRRSAPSARRRRAACPTR